MQLVRSLLFGLFILSVLVSGCLQSSPPVKPDTPADQPVQSSIIPSTPSQTPAPKFISGTWNLISYQNTKGNQTPVLSKETVTITFNTTGTMSGSAGCNQYSGTYQTEDSHLNMSPISITMRYCEDADILSQESAYLNLLSNSDGFSLSDGKLHLADRSGKTILIYEVKKDENIVIAEQTPNLSSSNLSKPIGPKSVPLSGVNWQLISYMGEKGLLQKPLPDSAITGTFSRDGIYSGSSGCNQYAAHYSTNSSGLQIQAPVVTKMNCLIPQGVMNQEKAYLSLLPLATSFRSTTDQLLINDKEGRLILMFRLSGDANQVQTNKTPVSSLRASDLTQNSWIMRSYQGQDGRMLSPINGVTVDAFFDPNMTISGSAGCNRYSALYSTSGSSIKISELSTTAYPCPYVTGQMEQEMQYTADLKKATRYEVLDGVLTLRGSDDLTLITYMNPERLKG